MLRLGVVTIFVATLALGVLLPIYTDEVTWKAVTARTFLDGFVNIWVFPQCVGSFAVAPPWFMLPARLLDHWLYSDLSRPESLRLPGLAILACWLMLALVALPRWARGVRGLPYIALCCALLGLGVLPLILIMNRPEQLMRLLITLLLAAPFVLKKTRPGPVGAVIRALAIVFVATLLFSHHPKSVYFTPLILTSAFYIVPGIALRATTAVGVALLAWGATDHWYARVTCPEDPWVQTFIGQKMLSPSALVPGLSQAVEPTGPNASGATSRAVLLQVRDNIFRCPRYVSETLIRATYNAGWLPRSDPPAIAPAVNVAIGVVWSGVVLLCIGTLASHARRVVRTRRLSRRTAMVLALSAPLMGLCLLEGHKAFYESGLTLPLLGLVLVLGLHCRHRSRRGAFWQAASVMVLVTSLVSMATLWATILPHLGGWLARGYVPGQRLSISAFGAGETRDEAHVAARLCGIDPSRKLEHLVVDSLTYTAFDNLQQPYFALYTLDRPDVDVLGLLSARGSAGMVISCGAVPHSLKRRVRRFGNLCCMPPFGESGTDSTAAVQPPR